jgi:hypothetical protein
LLAVEYLIFSGGPSFLAFFISFIISSIHNSLPFYLFTTPINLPIWSLFFSFSLSYVRTTYPLFHKVETIYSLMNGIIVLKSWP